MEVVSPFLRSCLCSRGFAHAPFVPDQTVADVEEDAVETVADVAVDRSVEDVVVSAFLAFLATGADAFARARR